MARKLLWEFQNNNEIARRKEPKQMVHTFDKKAFKKQIKENVKTLISQGV